MVKDGDTLKRVFRSGQTITTDNDARYTYSLFARCSMCGSEAFATRCEPGPSLNRAVFRCSSCFHQFETTFDNIFWI
jgi:hypothetical protein